MNAIEQAAYLLKPTADLYTPKSELYYPVFVDKNDMYIQEVVTDEHGAFCEDCVEWAVSYFASEYKAKNYKCKGSSGIDLELESSPESDDFTVCSHCREHIDVGVLHAFSQEIDHWTDIVTDEDFARQLSFPQDAWTMHELLISNDAQEAYQEELLKLANRILSTLCHSND